MCWVFSAGTSFQIVIHGQLQPTFLQRSFVGLRLHTGDWAGAKCPKCRVLAQRCGCCQVVVYWYWMLCHTQYIHNLAWNEQWSGTASAVCLCPLLTSSVQPLGWDWEPPCTEALVHWCALWRRGANPTTAQGILLFPQLVGVCHWSWLWGVLWALYRGAMKCTTLHLWAANLNPFLVAHSCMAFAVCCRCLSMVSRERPRKQIARSSTKSALKMSMAIIDGSSLIFSPKHVTARTPPVGTPSSG